MELSLAHQRKYYEDLHRVLQGNVSKLDTNTLSLPKLENSDD